LDEMERYHIDPKYRVDLQKYKIKWNNYFKFKI
jgi:hypothetical protein